ncbi:regulation of enolase protein 1 (concanavalin A-like superfamily) [Parabacteroides sp. PFB2-12]|uniref:DUF1349 domain-containing protein n=1 Tax=unclassified Parabacteroides TaxID=2649774 RepID=UPI0024765E7F|nr:MULTISPECIES: DUF1349 domain-containing protein [unclassified Parabacteroides]MDH6343821.1 regulation of enolase protein 1 (concanavalin A-like superfamily) [Parabacteroides sp. PM6-13]MDH6391527.1 regulation of enolase protein 1 (concanavalin A-like superfamily) [Parabacteroides sp. PFB2-12]
MKKKKLITLAVLGIVLFSSCTNGNTNQPESAKAVSADSAQVSGVACQVTISDIRFTKSINNAASLISVDENNKVTFTTGEKTDYFADPDNKLSNRTAPVLLSEVDNTKPFTLTAKVTPEFTETGLYNAGVLYIYVHDNFWQKLCFEQDERGKHRVVSVRTIGTSDDNNHDIVEQPFVYMKISSDTRTIASYYSLDNQNWQMVRLYQNNYPAKIWMGISTQCPKDKGSSSTFEELHLVQKSVADFRLGV